jgi:hypothetical protein
MEGFTNEEIRLRLKISRVGVERRLALIRRTWPEEEV